MTSFFMDALESINSTLRCDTATDGKIALEKLKVRISLPDLIFLELHIPHCSVSSLITPDQIKKAVFDGPVTIKIRFFYNESICGM